MSDTSIIDAMLDGRDPDEQPAAPAHESSDKEDMISAVRRSVDRHRDDAPEPEQHEALVAQEEQREEQQRQQRDGRGRFQSKGAAEVAMPVDVNAPPTSFSAQAKAEWDSLSPVMKDAFLKREGEFLQGREQYQADRQRWKGLDDVLTQVRPIYEKYGVKDDATAVATLAGLAVQMEQDPAGTIQRVAQQYGVDLRQMGGASPQQIEALGQQRARAVLEQQAGAIEAYIQQKVAAGISEYRQQHERTVSKVRASSASLHGGPYGTPEPPRKSNGGITGHYGDVADAVRDAVAALR